MTVDEIKELIQVVTETGIAELELQRGENRVRIRRATVTQPQEYVVPAPPVLAPVASHIVAPATHAHTSHATTAVAQTAPIPAPAEAETIYVKSPIVGTFYEAGSPDAPPFVKVGDRVTPG